jgi:NTP pyrophosphatase (non-canonical NTP hydrolase)
MSKQNFLDPEKLTEWQQKIWEIATAHGWHDKPLSPEHYCGLIMTEMAEAIEADRNGRRAYSDEFEKLLGPNYETSLQLAPGVSRSNFEALYKNYIKGSIEEEFADVVIRLLDMAQEVHGDKMEWHGYYPYGQVYHVTKSFLENAWYFIREMLNWGYMNISDCVSFMFDWANHLDIDLNKHIAWKIKYNELRPYKHGGKKY